MCCFSDASDSGYGAHGIEHPVLSGKDSTFAGSSYINTRRLVLRCNDIETTQ
jgi:hypothetical protein